MLPGSGVTAEKAREERSISMDVYVDPSFDPLRKDPRFEQTMARMGLGK